MLEIFRIGRKTKVTNIVLWYCFCFLGADVTLSEPCSLYELHITGDISRAIIQYLYATKDVNSIQYADRFGDLLAGIANFWVSTLKFNSERNLYEILSKFVSFFFLFKIL